MSLWLYVPLFLCYYVPIFTCLYDTVSKFSCPHSQCPNVRISFCPYVLIHILLSIYLHVLKYHVFIPYVYLFLCLYLPRYFYLYVSMSLSPYFCIPIPKFSSLRYSMSLCPYVSMFLSLCFLSTNVPMSICLCFLVPINLFLFPYVLMSLYLYVTIHCEPLKKQRIKLDRTIFNCVFLNVFPTKFQK